MAGIIKIAGIKIEIQVFDGHGFPAWFRITFGVLQILGGLLIMYPKSESAGILVSFIFYLTGLILLIYCQIYSHIIFPLFFIMIVFIYLRMKNYIITS